MTFDYDKYEEDRRDYMMEQKLRSNFDFALQTVAENHGCVDAKERIEDAMLELKSYGWDLGIAEFFEYLEELE